VSASPASSTDPALSVPAVRWLGRIDYAQGLAIQEEIVSRHLAGKSADTLLLLEHDPVFTIGRRPDRSSLGDPAHLPAPLIEIGRGGQATWHGPGQLVGYPILNLVRYGQDLHHYLRALEEGIMQGCHALGVPAERSAGQTGVWAAPGRKLASIGVGARRWISMHGFAINVSGDLSGFSAITPCGIAGVIMTSLEREGAPVLTTEAAAAHFTPYLLQALCALTSHA
jgi:lipoyl(octanoyl) transferase